MWRGVKKGGPAYRVKPPSRIGVAIGAGIAKLGDPYIRGGTKVHHLGVPHRGPFEGASHMRYLEGSQTAEQNLLRVWLIWLQWYEFGYNGLVIMVCV